MNIIIGHKKPDSDAILAAIALSEVLKIEGKSFKPKRVGDISRETKYILEKTGFDAPKLIKSVAPVVKDNIDKNYPIIKKDTALYDAITILKQNKLIKLPVVDNNKFIGVLDFYRIADFVLDKGPIIDISKHKISDFISQEKTISPDDKVDIYENQLDDGFVKFITDGEKYIGALTEYSVLKPKRYNVYLVDHNEFSQAVDGIEYAKIIGLFDHHKLSFKTNEPIDVRVRPLGSTCAVIYEYVLDKGYKISKKLKKLLLYGMVADTMGFRLITTTELDKAFVKDLTRELGLDFKKIDAEIIKASTNIDGIDLEKLLFGDFKEFMFGTIKVGFGVITIAEYNQIKDKIDNIKHILQKVKDNENYDFLGIMVCEILTNKTKVIGFGDAMDRLAQNFKKEVKNNGFEVMGILSRKKQIIPVISKIYS